MSDQAELGEEAGLGKAGNTLLDVGKYERLASLVVFDEVKKAEFY